MTDLIVVPDMQTRKREMFERSDAFVVLPGGIGTLEEVVELMSWRRLGLHRKPLGKCHVQVCTNISCLILGADDLYEHAAKSLGIGNKEVTPDGQFSLEEVECMGACSWAPAVQLNYDFHHNVTPEKLDQLLAEVRKAH